MGAFFTNVQVFCGDEPGSKVTEAVSEAVLKRLSGGRGMAVANPTNCRWVSVYDEACESQDPKELEALAGLVSEAVDGSAVSVMVHDSSILDLGLFVKGRLVDRWVNMPEYFGRVSKKKKAAVQGRSELWGDYLAEGRTAEELRSAWNSESVFAEDTLSEIAKILDWDAEASSVGFNYLEDTEPGNLQRLGDKKEPATEASGPVKLVLDPGVIPSQVSVDVDFHIQLVTSNRGEARRGLRVILSSPAFADDSFEVKAVMAILGHPLNGHMTTISGAELECSSPADVHAVFPDLELRCAPKAAGTKPSAQELLAMIDLRINLGIHGVAHKAGPLPLMVAVASTEDMRGSAAQVLQLLVEG